MAVGLVMLWVLYPHFYTFAARLSCYPRLRRLCRSEGVRLRPGHRLWLFGGKRGTDCDFRVETRAAIYAIKLFGIPKRTGTLFLGENGTYRIRSTFVLSAWFAAVPFHIDGRARPLPRYRFPTRDEAGDGKPIRRVLLLLPAPMEIRLIDLCEREALLYPGDTALGMQVLDLTHFLRMVAAEGEKRR